MRLDRMESLGNSAQALGASNNVTIGSNCEPYHLVLVWQCMSHATTLAIHLLLVGPYDSQSSRVFVYLRLRRNMSFFEVGIWKW